ncbi:MAG: hypothetical protein KA792_10065 [Bacteroidales bacterium]|nr:hypothetical protein [Bacteroidales bacterium]
MFNKNIKSFEDLQAEKQRLKYEIAISEQKMKSNVEKFKYQLSFDYLLESMLSKIKIQENSLIKYLILAYKWFNK